MADLPDDMRSPAEVSPARGRFIPAAALLLIAMTFMLGFGVCRQAPVGNDADEYLLAAETLLARGELNVKGIHATKYPPLTALVAAGCLALGLPVWPAFGVVNALCLLLASLLVLRLFAARGHPWAGLAAALFIGLNAIAWNRVNTIGSDILCLFLGVWILTLSLADRPWSGWRVAGVTLLLCAAISTRTVGAVLVVAPIASVVYDTWPRRRARTIFLCLILALTPLLIHVLFSLYERRFGPHLATYAGEFMLKDPLDPTRGGLTLGALAARTFGRVLPTARDVAEMLTVYSLGRFVSLATAAMLLLCALGLGRREAWVALALAACYGGVIVIWPFHDLRHGLPLLPVAGLGVGVLAEAAALQPSRWLRLFLAALLLGHLANSAGIAAGTRATRAVERTEAAGQLRELLDWIDARVPAGESVASFSYVELALRNEHALTPLQFSASDAELAARLRSGGARWLLVTEAFGRDRGARSRALQQIVAPDAAPAFSNAAFDLYRLL